MGLFTALGAIKEHILHLVAAEHARLLLAQYPAHRIHYVAFATTIRTNNTRYTIIKMNGDFIAEAFEALDFNRL